MVYLPHAELKPYVCGDFQLWLRYMLVIPVRRAVWLVTHLKQERITQGEDNYILCISATYLTFCIENQKNASKIS